MATQNPAAPFVQNENLNIHGGKGAGAVKPDGVIRTEKKKKAGLKDRKALADLSRPGKPPATAAAATAAKGVGFKNRSAAPAKDNGKSAVRDAVSEKPPKAWVLTDEETSKCREWAEEGIEYAPFTGNDAEKLDRETREERVRKEVEMVMNSLEVWKQRVFDVALPPREPSYDFEHLTKLEMDPEVALPTRPLFTLGDEKFDDIFLETEFPLLASKISDVDIKLKDSDDDSPCF